jgi:prepilin-type N-terminal cleavage/methylation domain-containing protein
MRAIDKKEGQLKAQRGFSLLELVVAIGILTVVIAVLTDGMMRIAQRSASDVNKVGLAQESRQFMDQILRDLRQSGYPSLAMFDAGAIPAPTSSSTYVAQGLISFSATAVQFEGDVDGSGVSEVYIQSVVPTSGSCPCKVQRGTVLKSVGGTPAYYTELDNVMNSSIFTAYKYDGSAWVSGTDSISLIKNIGITLYVQSPTADLSPSATFPTTTMVSEARINN